jgi:hypothetical protein
MRSIEAMEPKGENLSLNMEKPVATGTPPVNKPEGVLMVDGKVLTPLHPHAHRVCSKPYGCCCCRKE